MKFFTLNIFQALPAVPLSLPAVLTLPDNVQALGRPPDALIQPPNVYPHWGMKCLFTGWMDTVGEKIIKLSQGLFLFLLFSQTYST